MIPTLSPLGEGEQSGPEKKDSSNDLGSLFPVTGKPLAAGATPVKKGYYVIAYKLNKEVSGRYHYLVTDHNNIEQFIQHKLEFGSRTYDVKIIERVDDFLEAQSVADMLTIEENFDSTKTRKVMTMQDLINWLKQKEDIKTFFKNLW